MGGIEAGEIGGVWEKDLFEDEAGGERQCVVEEATPHREGAAEEVEVCGGVDFVFVLAVGGGGGAVEGGVGVEVRLEV